MSLVASSEAFISSLSPTMEISEVSLSVEIQMLPRPGSASRSICGHWITKKICRVPMPTAMPASTCPRGMAVSAPRNTSEA
ncbi:hypothetical protein D3C84_1162290 [compost metagenome]